MFVSKIQNKVRTVTAIIGITLLSSMPVGALLRAPATFDVAFASPVTAENLIELTNDARVDNGLVPLSVNALLVQSAQGKSNDMLEKDYFAHTSPDGLSPWYWFQLVGYNYTYAGENLAKNFATAEGLFDAWMDSSTHRANILSENYKDIGIAVAANESVIYVTQHFGSRQVTSSTATTTPPTAAQTRGQTAPTFPADTTPPLIKTTGSADGTIEQGGTVGFSLEVEGEPVSVTAKVGSKTMPLTLSDGLWVGEIKLYAGGQYDVVIEAADAAGNVTSEKIGVVTVTLPEDIAETPNARTLVAAYWKDVATNEAAPISVAMVVILLILGISWTVAVEKRRLGTELARLVILPPLLQ